MKNQTFKMVDERYVPLAIDLIEKRIKWMDRMGLKHWNDENYFEAFPPEYFLRAAREGALFALFEEEAMICTATLWESDLPWDDDLPSIYIHNLASNENIPGCGSAMLSAIESYAKSIGKQALRLDAASHNVPLNNYYIKHGFTPVGTTSDVNYHGNKLEKQI